MSRMAHVAPQLSTRVALRQVAEDAIQKIGTTLEANPEQAREVLGLFERVVFYPVNTEDGDFADPSSTYIHSSRLPRPLEYGLEHHAVKLKHLGVSWELVRQRRRSCLLVRPLPSSRVRFGEQRLQLIEALEDAELRLRRKRCAAHAPHGSARHVETCRTLSTVELISASDMA
jgi:hypothetical protein